MKVNINNISEYSAQVFILKTGLDLNYTQINYFATT